MYNINKNIADGVYFDDANGNGIKDGAELFTDLDSNGVYSAGDTWVDSDSNGVWNDAEHTYTRDEVLNNRPNELTSDLASFNRGGQIGYDDYGNEIDDDWTGPREPTVTSYYINDKFESGEVVINAGVRIDNFMMDDWRMKDPANPGWDANNQSIVVDQFEESEVNYTSAEVRFSFSGV